MASYGMNPITRKRLILGFRLDGRQKQSLSGIRSSVDCLGGLSDPRSFCSFRAGQDRGAVRHRIGNPSRTTRSFAADLRHRLVKQSDVKAVAKALRSPHMSSKSCRVTPIFSRNATSSRGSWERSLISPVLRCLKRGMELF